MKLFTQAGWVTMQVAIFGGVIWLWSMGPDPDRGPFHVAVLAGAFLAYTFTLATLMVIEAVKLIAGKLRTRAR